MRSCKSITTRLRAPASAHGTFASLGLPASCTMAAFAHCGSIPTAPCRWRPSQRPQCTASRSQTVQCRAAASSDSSSGAPSTSGRSAAASQRGGATLAQQAALAAAGLAGAVVGASAVSALFATGPAGAATQAVGEGLGAGLDSRLGLISGARSRGRLELGCLHENTVQWEGAHQRSRNAGSASASLSPSHMLKGDHWLIDIACIASSLPP